METHEWICGLLSQSHLRNSSGMVTMILPNIWIFKMDFISLFLKKLQYYTKFQVRDFLYDKKKIIQDDISSAFKRYFYPLAKVSGIWNSTWYIHSEFSFAVLKFDCSSYSFKQFVGSKFINFIPFYKKKKFQNLIEFCDFFIFWCTYNKLISFGYLSYAPL